MENKTNKDTRHPNNEVTVPSSDKEPIAAVDDNEINQGDESTREAVTPVQTEDDSDTGVYETFVDEPTFEDLGIPDMFNPTDEFIDARKEYDPGKIGRTGCRIMELQ